MSNFNKSGYYDGTASKAIGSVDRSRNKLVHDTIREIKNICEDRKLEIGRIGIRDKVTGKKYL